MINRDLENPLANNVSFFIYNIFYVFSNFVGEQKCE
jgi:hypothetical protein